MIKIRFIFCLVYFLLVKGLKAAYKIHVDTFLRIRLKKHLHNVGGTMGDVVVGTLASILMNVAVSCACHYYPSLEWLSITPKPTW